jgi:hypothetical protein
LDEFWSHKRSADGKQPWCKDCSSKRRVQYYREHKPREDELREVWNAEYRKWYIGLKDKKTCANCGGIFYHAAMQWHHPQDDKLANVADLARKRASKQRVLDEIAKCELWCGNCHATLTWAGEIV